MKVEMLKIVRVERYIFGILMALLMVLIAEISVGGRLNIGTA